MTKVKVDPDREVERWITVNGRHVPVYKDKKLKEKYSKKSNTPGKTRSDFKTDAGYETYKNQRHIFGENYNYDKLASIPNVS